MVALIPKSQIQGFNIDTVEKALVFAALALRAALVGSDDGNAEDQAVSIDISVTSETQANLNLEIYLPYTAYGFNTQGGQLLDSILEYESNAPSLESDLNLESQPNSSGFIIPDYDETVITTFEKYLVYYSTILWASVANKQSNTISLTFLGNQDNPQVWISINLPLDLNQWLLGGNYLDATVVDPSINSNPDDDDSLGETVTYYYSFENVAEYSLESLHTVTNSGILEAITIDSEYNREIGVWDIHLFLNEVEIFPEDFFDYGDGSYDWVFDLANNPIFLEPGDELAFELYDEQVPRYLDFSIYIEETGAQP